MTDRIWNFSAGPAVLPLTVLEEAQRDLVSLPGVGMSMLEISHRSKPFEAVIQEAEKLVRELYRVPDDYSVMFLQGGATLQFSMLAMNLMEGKPADYILTGTWSEKAVDEAKKVGEVRIAGSTQQGGYKRIPTQQELKLNPDAAYVHFTSNNTIYGTEWFTVPQVGSVPLICDMSSDLMSRPVDTRQFALIYGGVQKNLAPSGATLVIIRNDLLKKSTEALPTMMNYKIMAENKSLYNTPPVFTIYVANLVLRWIRDLGGLEAMERLNREKAKILYDAIDGSGGFYRGHAEEDSRSLMNVTFRLPDEKLEDAFAKKSEKSGFSGLKGHRSVGGLRASIYNAFPKQGVEKLVEFMETFQKENS